MYERVHLAANRVITLATVLGLDLYSVWKHLNSCAITVTSKSATVKDDHVARAQSLKKSVWLFHVIGDKVPITAHDRRKVTRGLSQSF